MATMSHLLLLVGSLEGSLERGAGILDLLGMLDFTPALDTVSLATVVPDLAPASASLVLSLDADLVTEDTLGLDLLEESSCLADLFSSEPNTGRLDPGVAIATDRVPVDLLLSANFFRSALPARPVFILETAVLAGAELPTLEEAVPPILGLVAEGGTVLLAGLFLVGAADSEDALLGFATHLF